MKTPHRLLNIASALCSAFSLSAPCFARRRIATSTISIMPMAVAPTIPACSHRERMETVSAESV